MKTSRLSNSGRRNFLTYAFVIAAYIILQLLSGGLSSSIKGMPTCLHEEFEEEITLPGLERRAPADHWPENLGGSGRNMDQGGEMLVTGEW